MKVLILPCSTLRAAASIEPLVINLVRMFDLCGFQCAVCSPYRTGLKNVTFLPSPAAAERRKDISRMSLEEEMNTYGELSASFLAKDGQAILEAVEKFEPDRIIEIQRPAAVILKDQTHAPIVSIITSSLVRGTNIPASSLKGVNKFLASLKQRQVIRLCEVYEKNDRLVTFGPAWFQAFPPSMQVYRIGAPILLPMDVDPDGRVCVFLCDVTGSTRKWKKSIDESFKGANYDVFLAMPGLKTGADGNMHYLSRVRSSTLAGSAACVHDGSLYTTLICLALAVPQLILKGGDQERLDNAALICSAKAGVCISESEADVSTIYENYRVLLSDDAWKERAIRLQEDLEQYGWLDSLLEILAA